MTSETYDPCIGGGDHEWSEPLYSEHTVYSTKDRIKICRRCGRIVSADAPPDVEPEPSGVTIARYALDVISTRATASHRASEPVMISPMDLTALTETLVEILDIASEDPAKYGRIRNVIVRRLGGSRS